MKKAVLVLAMSALMAAVTVQAQEAAVTPAPAPAPAKAHIVKKDLPPLQELELVGKVIQKEKIGKDKAGAEVKKMLILLDISADGLQVALPANKKANIDPATFVGKDVKVSAQGYSKVDKKGRKSFSIVNLNKIEEVTPAAAPAPAAPVPAPAK